MGKRTCDSCDKPLGGTTELCFDCGGEGNRGGKPIDPHFWQMMLGVKPEQFKHINFERRNIDDEEHPAHHAAGGSD